MQTQYFAQPIELFTSFQGERRNREESHQCNTSG